MKIGEIRENIQQAVCACFSEMGFSTEKCPCFYQEKNTLIRIIHLGFPLRKNILAQLEKKWTICKRALSGFSAVSGISAKCP